MLFGLVQWSLVSAHAQASGERTGQVFFIQGAVRKPGVYQLEGKISLLKLIINAGGLTETHGSTAYIIRKRSSQRASSDARDDDKDPEYDVITVNIELLLKEGIDESMYLQQGDIVNVPIAEIFFLPDNQRRLIKPSQRYLDTPPIRKLPPCRKGACIARFTCRHTHHGDAP